MRPKVHKRHQDIIALINHHQEISIDSIAEQLNVTVQTIRKDVESLAFDGALFRMHGKVRKLQNTSEIPYESRRYVARFEKTKMAQLVAQKIPHNCSIFITLSTTTDAVASALSEHKNMQIITNSLHAAEILYKNTSSHIIITPGKIRPQDGGIVGEDAIEFINKYKSNYAILGADAIDDEGYLMDHNYREARINNAVMRNSQYSWLVTDNRKFGRAAKMRFGHVRDLQTIVTNKALPSHWQDMLSLVNVTCYTTQNHA